MTAIWTLAIALSLAALLTLGLVRLHLKTKSQAYEDKRRRGMIALQLGTGHPPAWYQKGSALDVFLVDVRRRTSRKRVPDEFLSAVLGKEVNLRRLIWYMGTLEDLDAPRAVQQMAAADLIVEWWIGEERAR